MNTNVKVFLGVAAGLLAGGSISYIFTKKKYEKETQDAINEQSDHYRKKVYDLEKEVRKLKRELKTVDIEEETVEVKKDGKETTITTKVARETNINVDPNRMKEDYTDYNAIYKEKNEPYLSEDDAKEAIETSVRTLSDGSIFAMDEPYPISEEEFEEMEGQLDNISCEFYTADSVIVEVTGKVIDDKFGTVGRFDETWFDQYSWDNGVVGVRNTKLGIDYLIDKVEGLYSDYYG